MPKKSKFFRIATEGATTDGRVISRAWIEQMARNYDPKKYGARINLEHLKALYPDSTFRRYGDVLALEARAVEDDKLGLFAQIDPTESMVSMVKNDRQKVYTSIEVDPNFADTGEAYLVGLALTDDPASLGTEMLQFSAKASSSPLAKRKANPHNLFSEAVEALIEFEEDAKSSDEGKGLFTKVMNLLQGKSKTDDSRFSDHGSAIEAIAESQRDLLDRFSSTVQSLQDKVVALTTSQQQDRAALTALTEKLSNTPDGHRPRPSATGGKHDAVTDC